MNPKIRTQTDYSEQVFQGVDLAGADLVSSVFYDCEFVGCSLVGTRLRDCRFVRCTFRQCDLSLLQVPGSVFSATRFEDSQAIGIDWTQADWRATRLGRPLAFFKCALNHSTFIGLSLHEIQIRDCVAVEVDFREADLSRANLAGTDLSGSLFANTNLMEADLRGARNYHIDPGQNVLKRARFSLPEALALLYSMDIVLVEEEA
jgi:fluoroquinolone resistance protein